MPIAKSPRPSFHLRHLRSEETRFEPIFLGFHQSCELNPGVLGGKCYNIFYLVVLTIFKNISQWEGLSHILWKIKNVPNHQPVFYC